MSCMTLGVWNQEKKNILPDPDRGSPFAIMRLLIGPNPNSHPTGWNRIPTNWNDRQKEKNNARKQSASQRQTKPNPNNNKRKKHMESRNKKTTRGIWNPRRNPYGK